MCHDKGKHDQQGDAYSPEVEIMSILCCLLAGSFSAIPVNLQLLPSPSTIEDIVRKDDLNAYVVALNASRAMSNEFLKSSVSDRDLALKTWLKTIRKRHAGFASQYKGYKSWPRKYKMTSAMNDVDMTKIDLLLLLSRRKTIFQTEAWLRKLYSVDMDMSKHFSLPSKVTRVPNMFLQHTGPRLELSVPSFDPYFKVESRYAMNWLAKGLKGEVVNPMEPTKMIKKMVRFEKEFENRKKRMGI